MRSGDFSCLNDRMRKAAIHLIVLFVAIVSIYGSGLSGGFVWDDEVLILQKKDFFHNPRNIGAIFQSSDTPLYERSTPYYRPLTVMSYMADRHLWGDNPFGYRLENLVLHGGVTVLLYLLVGRAFADDRLAFLCALIFAIHPVGAEPVNFISARNNLLCGVFLVGALHLLLRRTTVGFLASIGSYGLALLSKEPAVVLPFFLFSLALLAREERLRTRERTLAVFFVMMVLYFLLRFAILGTLATGGGIDFSASRFGLMISALYENFRILLFPLKLNAFYTEEFIAFRPYKAVGAAAGVGTLVYCSLHRGVPEPVKTGSLWILWSLLPISNLVLIPNVPVAERYLYVPVMGFALMAGYLLNALSRKYPMSGTAFLAFLCLLFGARTFERTFAWGSNIALYQSMITADPGNAEAHYNLGYEYLDSGRLELAVREWNITIRLNPMHAKAYNSIGNAYAITGDFRKALSFYDKTLRIAPEQFVAHFNFARAADLLGEREEAIRHYRIFLEKGEGSEDPQHVAMVAKAKKRLEKLTEGLLRE